jgi:hypothetical protein
MGRAFIRMQVMILGQFGHALADLGRSGGQGLNANLFEDFRDGLKVGEICAVLEPLRASATSGEEGGEGGSSKLEGGACEEGEREDGSLAAGEDATGGDAQFGTTAATTGPRKVSGEAALEKLKELAGKSTGTSGVAKLKELAAILDPKECLLRLSVWCYEEALLVLDPALQGYDGAGTEADTGQVGGDLSPIEWARRLSQRLAAVSNEIGQHFISLGISSGQRDRRDRDEQSRSPQEIPLERSSSCVPPFNQAMDWLSKALSTFEDPLVQDGQNSVLVRLNISKVMKLRAEFDWNLSMHEQHQLYQKAADECLAAKTSMSDRKANAKLNASNTLLSPVSNELAMTYLTMGVKLGVKLLAARKQRQQRQQINKVNNANANVSTGERDADLDSKAGSANVGDAAQAEQQQSEQQLEHMKKVIEFEALQLLEKDEQKVSDTVVESLNKALQQYIELSAHDQIAATHFQMASFLRKWIIERGDEGQTAELEKQQQRERREQRQLELTMRHYSKALQFFSQPQQRDLVKGTLTSDLTTVIVLHELCDLHEAVAVSPVGTGGGGNHRVEHLEKALGYLLQTRGPFSALAKPLPPPSCAQLSDRVPKQRQSLNSVLLRLIHAAKQPSGQQHARATAATEKRVAAYKRMYRTALSGAQKNISELLLELEIDYNQLRPE